MAIKTLFLGSNWESLETLKTLFSDNRFEIVAVITAPDKPAGRKQILTPTPVNTFSKENGIPVHITNSDAKRYQEALDLFKPELIVCKAFGEIIPKFFLEYPKYKSINIHFSILPKYRGAVPIQMAILSGDNETGVTFVRMVEKLDAGEILKTIKEKILPVDTNLSLRKRLVEISAKAMPDLLIRWVEGKITPFTQDESKATYCFMKDIAKEKAEIKWKEMEAEYIDRLVRAMTPWPTAWCTFKGKRMKILEAKFFETTERWNQEYKIQDKKLVFKTKDGYIELIKIQIEGKKEVFVKDYINSLK